MPMHFDSFVVGECNRLALDACRSVGRGDFSQGSLLLLWGPPGDGKSRLLGGIEHKWTAAGRGQEIHKTSCWIAYRRPGPGLKLWLADDVAYVFQDDPKGFIVLVDDVSRFIADGGRVVMAATADQAMAEAISRGFRNNVVLATTGESTPGMRFQRLRAMNEKDDFTPSLAEMDDMAKTATSFRDAEGLFLRRLAERLLAG